MARKQYILIVQLLYITVILGKVCLGHQCILTVARDKRTDRHTTVIQGESQRAECWPRPHKVKTQPQRHSADSVGPTEEQGTEDERRGEAAGTCRLGEREGGKERWLVGLGEEEREGSDGERWMEGIKERCVIHSL